METAAERRKRKLIALIKQHGVKAIAEKADLNWQSLDQVAKGHKNEPRLDGTRTDRNLGDPSARAIETALELGTGWFDLDDSVVEVPAPAPSLDPFEELLLKTFRKFSSLEAKHNALVELNNLLVKEQGHGAPSSANPVIGKDGKTRGRSIFGELDEAPAPKREGGKR